MYCLWHVVAATVVFLPLSFHQHLPDFLMHYMQAVLLPESLLCITALLVSAGNFYLTWTPGADTWQPHNRPSPRRVQNMGWTPANELWLSVRGGDLLISAETGAASEKFDKAKLGSRGFGILDVGWACLGLFFMFVNSNTLASARGVVKLGLQDGGSAAFCKRVVSQRVASQSQRCCRLGLWTCHHFHAGLRMIRRALHVAAVAHCSRQWTVERHGSAIGPQTRLLATCTQSSTHPVALASSLAMTASCFATLAEASYCNFEWPNFLVPWLHFPLKCLKTLRN